MTIHAVYHGHECEITDAYHNPVIDTVLVAILLLDDTPLFRAYSSKSHEHPGLEPVWVPAGVVEEKELENIHIVQGEVIDLETAVKLEKAREE
jgi:hypothetical protein